MTVKVKKIMLDSPRQLNTLNEYYFGQVGGLEASPIYETFKVSVDISGSYTSGDYTYNYSYSGSKTWSRLQMFGDGITPPSEIYDAYINGVVESVKSKAGVLAALGVDEFYMGLRPAIDTNSSPNPMLSAQHGSTWIQLDTGTIEASAVIGTRTDDTHEDGDPGDATIDIVSNISTSGMNFSILGAFPTTARVMVNGFTLTAGASGLSTEVEEDASAWSATKWRDFRGTYTESNTNANGVTVDVELVLS